MPIKSNSVEILKKSFFPRFGPMKLSLRPEFVPTYFDSSGVSGVAPERCKFLAVEAYPLIMSYYVIMATVIVRRRENASKKRGSLRRERLIVGAQLDRAK